MTKPAPVETIIADILELYGRWGRLTPVATMRRDWDDFFRGRAVPMPHHKVDAGGVPAEWISASDKQAARTILFLHGGGFRIGSIDSHRDLAQRLSHAAEARVLAIDYRLCPEHRFPAPVEDAVAAYQWLLGSGMPAARIALAGDSAGAGLAISTMLAAAARGLPTPGAAVLMSAWTDMEATGRAYETLSGKDPIHQRPMILALARDYLAGASARDCLASPMHGDLRGLPPCCCSVEGAKRSATIRSTSRRTHVLPG